jgi:circadian clock protein KaiC
MFHSNQVREFKITNDGLKIVDLYLGPSGMLTGSARISQIAKEKADKIERQQEIERKQIELEQKRVKIDAQIEELKSTFEIEKQEFDRIINQEKLKEDAIEKERDNMSRIRHSNDD